MKLSVVTTLYCSETCIEEFWRRVSLVAQKLTSDYEIIFVNDGSPDNSLQLALALYEKDPHVKVIDLSRNFGHHRAIMTGLAEATGDYVFLIDVDLEEDPAYLEPFYQLLTSAPDCDVVYGRQIRRKGGFFERFFGTLFYKIFNFFSEVKIPENSVQMRLMTRRYVDNYVRFKDKELSYGALAVLAGFKQIPCDITKKSTSPTTYTPLKKFSALVNAVTSSTAKPLWLIFYTGLFVTSISLLVIIKLLVFWVLGSPPAGWTSVMITIFFFGGVNILFLGLIGIYLSKMFSEVKDRPYVVLKQKYSHNRMEGS